MKLAQWKRKKETDIFEIMERTSLRFVTCGSVDDGKSTLLGRLLLDTRSVTEDQVVAAEQESARYGTLGSNLDVALLIDGLQSEREQGITIDVAHRYFNFRGLRFVAADSPGHEQFTRNMVTAASNADVALLLLDASKGVTTQTKRHLSILKLLRFGIILVAVNKMDLVGYSQEVFEQHESELMSSIGKDEKITLKFIPVQARDGENVINSSKNMSWYEGFTVIDALTKAFEDKSSSLEAPLRLPIQWVNRQDENFRGYCGLIESGELREGGEIFVAPDLLKNKITELYVGNERVSSACAGQSITFSVERPMDAGRGSLVFDKASRPIIANSFSAQIIWMSSNPCLPKRNYTLKFIAKEVDSTIIEIEHFVDIETGDTLSVNEIKQNDIGLCKFFLNEKVAFDKFSVNKFTGSFLIVDKHRGKHSALA